MPRRRAIAEALALIFEGIARLKQTFPNRKFTIDGRLVGDLGEIIAALEYDVVLDVVAQPDYYLGFKLFPDGRHEEIFNGPGSVIYERYKHRKGIGVQLLSFPFMDHVRIPKREG
jgi:hypothetical protein